MRARCVLRPAGKSERHNGLKASKGGRGRAAEANPQVPRMESCAPSTPPPSGQSSWEGGREEPWTGLCWAWHLRTDDPSVTLAALVGWGLGTNTRTP